MARPSDQLPPEDEMLDDEELLDEELPPDEEGIDEKKAAISGWGISFAVHLIIVLILGTIVIAAKLVKDPPPVQVAIIEPPPPPPEEKKEQRELVEVQTEIVADVQVENPVVTQLDVPVEEISTEDEVVSEVATAKGREEAVSASETGGSGAFMAIGAGGGSAGAFGSRSGGGKRRAIGRFGGSKASESAVDAALIWFMRHQSPDGKWDVDGYPVNCTVAGPKCEPGQNIAGADEAATGYALLCFLGAGYDHKSPSKYRAVVQKGLDYLVAVQKPDGLIGDRNYEHPTATMALAEAFAMTSDPALRDPAQKGVDIILSRQLQDAGYGLGWDYVAPKADRVDSSVSGWNVMALKSAAAAGLNVGNGMAGAKNYLDKAWQAANSTGGRTIPTDAYSGKSIFPYTWNTVSGEVDVKPGNKTGHDLTPAGMVMAVFLGHNAGDIMLETMANHVMEFHVPASWNDTNSYYMYYSTMGIFQVGGDKWQVWNGKVRDMLVGAQRKTEDCFNGSFDVPQGAKWHGSEVGRVVSTAYATLSLEVYYRYQPVKH